METTAAEAQGDECVSIQTDSGNMLQQEHLCQQGPKALHLSKVNWKSKQNTVRQ